MKQFFSFKNHVSTPKQYPLIDKYKNLNILKSNFSTINKNFLFRSLQTQKQIEYTINQKAKIKGGLNFNKKYNIIEKKKFSTQHEDKNIDDYEYPKEIKPLSPIKRITASIYDDALIISIQVFIPLVFGYSPPVEGIDEAYMLTAFFTNIFSFMFIEFSTVSHQHHKRIPVYRSIGKKMTGAYYIDIITGLPASGKKILLLSILRYTVGLFTFLFDYLLILFSKSRQTIPELMARVLLIEDDEDL